MKDNTMGGNHFGFFILIGVIAFFGFKRYLKRGAKDKLKDAVDRFKQDQ
jgi:hypothetical protein